jgi:hypothetical protein
MVVGALLTSGSSLASIAGDGGGYIVITYVYADVIMFCGPITWF